MTIVFKYVNRQTKEPLAKVNIQFYISKYDIAGLIADYVDEKTGKKITDFIKGTTKEWTKKDIEIILRRSLHASGENFYGDYTDEQLEIALEIVNKLWED